MIKPVPFITCKIVSLLHSLVCCVVEVYFIRILFKEKSEFSCREGNFSTKTSDENMSAQDGCASVLQKDGGVRGGIKDDGDVIGCGQKSSRCLFMLGFVNCCIYCTFYSAFPNMTG